jgi:adenylate kinase family enzyme
MLRVPHVELDSLWWGPNWTPAGGERFAAVLRDVTAGDGWILDGNYFDVGAAAVAWPVADAVVWLDPPRSLAVIRTLRRSVARVIRRTELWSHNRQQVDTLSPRSILRLIRRWPSYSRRIDELLVTGEFENVTVVHLRRRRDVAAFLATSPESVSG